MWAAKYVLCALTCVAFATASQNSDRKRRNKMDIPEEPNVPVALASSLDTSCAAAKIMPPEISYGRVVLFDRRRKGKKVFLVAYFACNENYSFENENTAMFCSNEKWLGEIPTCIPEPDYAEIEDDGVEVDEDLEEYDTVATDDEIVEDGVEESQDSDREPPPPPPPPVKESAVPAVLSEFQPEPEIVIHINESETNQLEAGAQTPQGTELQTPEEPTVERFLETDPKTSENIIPQQVPTEEISPNNTSVAPTKDIYDPTLLDNNCGPDNGGCAHICKRLLYPDENEPVQKCDCQKGYTLDPNDYASCLDIDECQESNGGCSEICENMPGEYKCACQAGFQIDVSDGKTCVDIDECAHSELSLDCAEGCENLPGSYRCVLPLGEKVEAVEEPKLEVIDIPVTKTCNPGFKLSADGNDCLDIDECEVKDPQSAGCEQDCVNTVGSFRCYCRDGYHLLEDQRSCALDGCADLDKPELNRTRCAHACEDLPEGNYRCICPKGYELSEDQHSCQVEESACSKAKGSERCSPGTCAPSEDNTSFSCICPTGYRSEEFACQDIDECADSSHLCSHSCRNTPGGYQCLCPEGLNLVEEFTCVAEDRCEVNNNGCEQICLTAREGTCSCREGFRLSADGKSCEDVDECQVDNGGCQQVCSNLPGSYGCLCAAGYELLKLDGFRGYCFDIDECSQGTHGCSDQMLCENLNGSYTCLCPPGYALGLDNHIAASLNSSLSHDSTSTSLEPSPSSPTCLDIDECSLANGNCSHFCQNEPGGFQCSCPLGHALSEDMHSCRDIDECGDDNGQCSQLCLNQPGGFACACEAGYELTPDGFGCSDIDECSLNYGNCSDICINLLGTHACACERGYELAADKRTCQDVNECAGLFSGGCSHECINKAGTFECGCPLGYVLNEDGRNCHPALVGCPPGTRQSSSGCSPIVCGRGFVLGANDECEDVDECLEKNGGCSHRCVNSEGSFKCSCPPGYRLDSHQRICQDIDECAQDKTSCITGKCINEIGGFRCEFNKFPDLPEIPSVSTLPELPQPDSTKPNYPDFTELSNEIPKSPKQPAIPEFPSLEFPSLPKYPPDLPSIPPLGDLPTTTTTTTTTQAPVFKLPEVPRSPWSNPMQPRDLCPRFQAPRNGRSHCNRYRHKQKLFYNSRCRITCNPGYVLEGPAIKSCGVSGIWEGPETKCVALNQPRLQGPGICPALKPARNGVIQPPSCTQGPSRFGDVCTLQCNPGFMPTGSMLTSCMVLQGWSFGDDLNCLPFDSSLYGSQLNWGLWNIPQKVTPPPTQAVQGIRPYIKCPENVVILLHSGEQKAHVTLQRPQTNVKNGRLVAHTAWAGQLQGHLPAGVHKVDFRVNDPESQLTIGCHTIITVKEAQSVEASPLSFSPGIRSSLPRPAPFPFLTKSSSADGPFFSIPDTAPKPAPFPTFSTHSSPRQPEYPRKSISDQSSIFSNLEPFSLKSAKLIAPGPARGESTRVDLGSDSTNYCPPSIEVPLREHQGLRSVAWEEPRFEGKLLKIYKSHFPGALFKEGEHTIKYEATTTDGQTLRCTFFIRVRPATPTPPPILPEIFFDIDSESAPAQLRQLGDPGTYVICPDKEPVRVTADQSVDLPVGCTLKNVRPQSSPLKNLKGGKLTSLWHRYTHF
ncbi:LOW QUALITY PROTEIN: fibrillin-1 [Drosophila gunungcola]|uniref:LOW QUALITY PROTEIN: fibrillin-1 n=1 Tax=Drosophila gunungcola TaxID=103775 RepID=UPI0022E61925|nr:LOW QUALITY PROTEIN: fibrillin-1 [Drosophila gunungcola]